MNKFIKFFNAALLIFSFAVLSNASYVAIKSDTLPATPPVTPPSSPTEYPTQTPTPTPTTEPSVSPTTTPEQTVNVGGKSTGGVKGDVGDVQFKLTFNAHGGDKVKGVVNYWNSVGTEFKGRVDVCYNQSGNKAVFAGTVYEGKTTNNYFIVEVQDNGQGKKSEADRAWARLSAEKPNCSFVADTLGVVVNGNLQVHK